MPQHLAVQRVILALEQMRGVRRTVMIGMAATLVSGWGSGAAAQVADGFRLWKQEFTARAVAAGIREKTVSAALSGVSPLPKIIELDRKQPEKTIDFATYRTRVVNDLRIRTARLKMVEHRVLLDRVAADFGVPARYIVALWAVETDFGRFAGGFNVVASLATLAYDGRRAALFGDELIEALRILDRGEAPPGGLKGSWAGAMGQSQFMPSSFNKMAVDYDGDGRRDIWRSQADVFASMANYLKQSGWVSGQTWGRQVQVPESLAGEAGLTISKPLQQWQALGVRQQDGSSLPAADLTASLVMPDGAGGSAFLVYDNYRILMQWNRSTYFATSIGLLADMIGDA